MAGEDSWKTYGALPPDAALSLLGNEVRVGILLTLSRARGASGSPAVLSFSTLRERTDPAVDSSLFNYHLQRLVGTFVERVETVDGRADAQVVPEMAEVTDEGFRLRPEGTTLIRDVRAWTATGECTVAPFELNQDCYHCGSPLVAEYTNAIFAIQCPGCGYIYDYNLTPPGILAGPEDAVLGRVAEYNRQRRLAFARGSCPRCANAVDIEVRDPGAIGGYPRSDLRAVLIGRGCAHCGNLDYLTVGEALLGDAELIAFCHERGLDVTGTPIWELEFAATDRHTTVRGTDPWEIALSVTRDGDTLELVVDHTLTVTERART